MKFFITICFGLLLFKNVNAKLLIVENTRETKVATSYFSANDSMKCFVIEIYDATKNKYVFIRYYYYNTFKKQNLNSSFQIGNNSKTIFEQLNYNKLITSFHRADHVVNRFDSLILINKSKKMLIEGSFFVELFQWKKEANEIAATSTFIFNINQKPTSNIDSIERKFFNNYYNKYKNDLNENVLLYKKDNKVTFYRMVTPSRHFLTTYTKVIAFKKRKVIAFDACFCLFPKGEYMEYYSTDVKKFTKNKGKFLNLL